MNDLTHCQCNGPGNCPILKRDCDPPSGRNMVDVRHQECKNKPQYFEMFLSETKRSCLTPSSKPQTTESRPLLGDLISNALSKIGVTEERVSNWLGQPCGCTERKEKLNRLHSWAKRILSGKTENAEQYLNEITGDE